MKSLISEILAPCGNWDMVKASVRAGTDAIYLGTKEFSARAYAENFTVEDVKEVVKYCHLRNVKVYVTLNTLIKQSEIHKAIDYVNRLYNIDIDALIVQDIGLAYLVNKLFPDLDLHASTQMNINNLNGALIAKELGFKRIVLARETDLEELKNIRKNCDIEIEVFIHGSLCVCQSGQCLMSSLNGDRSANRGRCAQPCRKDYKIILANETINSKLSYLSPKDLRTIDNVDEIAKYCDSLKIEGRMKSKEYVYSIVKSYREKLDNGKYDYYLDEVKNRGFTKGLINNTNGYNYVELGRKNQIKGNTVGKVLGKGKIKFTKAVLKKDILILSNGKNTFPLTLTENYTKNSIASFKNIGDALENSDVKRVSHIKIVDESNEEKNVKFDLQVKFICKKFQPIQIFVNDLIYNTNIICDDAKNKPIDDDFIRNQVLKTGNYQVNISELEIILDDGLFLSKSQINQIRRDFIEFYLEEKADFNHRKQKNVDLKNLDNLIEKNRINNSSYKTVYVDEVDSYSDKISSEYIVRVPRFLNQEKTDKFIKKCRENNVSKLLINNIGDIAIARDINANFVVSDYQMNVFNTLSAKVLNDLGVDVITLSVELNKSEIKEIVENSNYNYELVVEENLVNMITIYCPFSSIIKCNGKNCEFCKFNDCYIEGDFSKYKVVRMDDYSLIYSCDRIKIDENDIDFNLYSIRKNKYATGKSNEFHFKKGIL
nr:U32 family peptidase [Finegoldia magna]